MTKTLIYIVGALVLLVGGFFAFNQYMYGQKQADGADASLTSKTWVWVAALYNDGREILPQEPQAFTLLFGTDGAFSATTDCNQMGGTYRLQGDQITFSDMFATKMFCEGSQEQAFTQLLADTQSYHITSSELVFDLKFDSGSVIFR